MGRRLNSNVLLDTLSEMFLSAGALEHICSDRGTETTSRTLKNRPAELGVKTAYIGPDSTWKNGFNENFNDRYRDEFLQKEELTTSRRHS